jgi:flagellar motor switch protein FliM
MAEVLSQQQIDDLLGKLQSGNVDFNAIEEQSSAKKIKEYDFLSPKKFTREQLRLLENIFDSFSRLFALYLSSLLRMSCQTQVLQAEEEEYREFSNALSDSVLVGVVGMHNRDCNIEDKEILIEISRPVSFCILDRMLGGDGSGYMVDRDYTDIELSLLEYLFKQITGILKNAWSNSFELEHTLDRVETNAQMIQFIQQDESVAIVVVEVTLNELKGNVNICLPAASLEEIFKIFDSRYVKVSKKSDPKQERQRRDAIMGSLRDTPLAVSAILGKTDISLRELLSLQRGDIIPLDTRVADNSVTVNVEDQEWFTGTLGTKKKKYAVRINKILQ